MKRLFNKNISGNLNTLAKHTKTKATNAHISLIGHITQTVEEMDRDEETEQVWEELYPELSKGKPGLAGAMASRAEAQVLRLSCVYALLDLSRIIKIEHLKAALAIWNYCEDSCKYIFGDALGDPVADQIRESLRERPDGMTRTEIRDIFGRHKKQIEIRKALALLLEYGLIKKEIRKGKTKPFEIWFSNESV